MRVKNGVEPINHTADTARGGSRPKPPKAVAQRASLEAPGAMSEHQTAKRRLTAKTVALDIGGHPPLCRCRSGPVPAHEVDKR